MAALVLVLVLVLVVVLVRVGGGVWELKGQHPLPKFCPQWYSI